MLIAIAGPYSADTPDNRQRNLAALNKAAAAVLNLGHIPVIGVNAALPIVECLGADLNQYDMMMAISLALVDRCDAILMIGESNGANREREVVRSKGLPVYLSIDEIPAASVVPDTT
jgi:hypothetical protein